MCNEIRRRVAVGQVRDAFSQLKVPLDFPEGIPNLAPLESVRITDPSAIVRMGSEAPELVVRRWSWPAPNGKPIYNMRSEGRNFAKCRCLILTDGFYEFTAPEDPKAKRKDKWLFTKKGEDVFAIAGIWRGHEEVGEAFTMLTAEPGPDVAPYHHRQIVVLDRKDWMRWLDPSVPSSELLKPLPAGSLEVERVR